MNNFILRELISYNIPEELKQIGFDESYRIVASDKFKYKNFKIYNLTPAQANILKQTALSIGADCATHRDVITGNIELSNVILGGSFSQLNKIAQKLKSQPFKLSQLGDKITKLMEPSQRKTKLAGVLNVTPDSFSDGGKYYTPIDAQQHLIQLIEDGADIIDIGAESTRPYAESISPDVQIERLSPILKFIQNENIKIPISIDTRSSIVADFALNNGASIINDVSGFDFDNKMPEIVKKYEAEVIIQHSLGTPKTMQDNPSYNNVVEDIYFKLKEKKELAESYGINQIILDVGIGFGKTKEDNYELLKRIEEFHSLDCPLMVGVSRKSLLGIKEDNNDLKDTLTAAISYPMINKVDYLRVHNVKTHRALLNICT